MPFLTSNITISKVDWWEQISSLQCGNNAVVEFYVFNTDVESKSPTGDNFRKPVTLECNVTTKTRLEWVMVVRQ